MDDRSINRISHFSYVITVGYIFFMPLAIPRIAKMALGRPFEYLSLSANWPLVTVAILFLTATNIAFRKMNGVPFYINICIMLSWMIYWIDQLLSIPAGAMYSTN